MKRILLACLTGIGCCHARAATVTFDLVAKNCAAWAINTDERDAYLAGLFTAYNEAATVLNTGSEVTQMYRSDTGVKVGFLGLRSRVEVICKAHPERSITDAATDAWFEAAKAGD